MTLVRYSSQQQIEKIEKQIETLKKQNVKGWFSVVRRHYQIKALKKQLDELNNSK